MNENTSCVVWSMKYEYSGVMTYKEAKELAMLYASQGNPSYVYQLKEVLYYGGRTIPK